MYDDKIASMEGVKSWYNQSDSTGFIRLNGLRLRARNLSQGGPKIGQ
jgi:argininosuccinate synthase